MALELDLIYLQSNDATILQLTDDTGIYDVVTNPTGWGAPNPVVTDIVASTDVTPNKYHLLLDVSVTDSSSTTIVYDQINLYDHDSTGPFADVGDLIWEFDAADFVFSGTPMGTDEDELTNGIYELTYTLVDADDHDTIQNEFIESILIDGDVRIKVYNSLRNISEYYDDIEETEITTTKEFSNILNTLFKYGLFRGMLANVSNATKSEVINILGSLEVLTINDTN